jgi:hypothetical protein
MEFLSNLFLPQNSYDGEELTDFEDGSLRLGSPWRLCAERALFDFVALEGIVKRKDAKDRQDEKSPQDLTRHD